MTQWTFVVAAYAVTVAGVGALILWAYVSMGRAEAAVDKLRK